MSTAAQDPVDVGIELGGTKVVVGASRGGNSLTDRLRIDTREPDQTLADVRAALRRIAGTADVAAVGIGTFGPVDLRPGSASFGTITNTPKPLWSGVDVFAGILMDLEGRPAAIDTDVNAALIGEHVWGAADTDTAAYLTIGTGIGGGIWANGGLVRGSNHPEVGHVAVRRHPDDEFPGSCPYHGACLEGMASGTALAARFGTRAEDMDANTAEQARNLAAFYVADGIVTMCSVVPVETVVIGGGVAHMGGFHDGVRRAVAAIAAGYPPVPFDEAGPTIVAPALGNDAGVLGAIELARRVRSGSP